NNSERAKSEITSSRQSGLSISRIQSTLYRLRFPRPERKCRGPRAAHCNPCAIPAWGEEPRRAPLGLVRAGREQGVGSGPAGPFLIDLGLHARGFRGQDIQALFQLGDAIEVEIFADRFDQALTTPDADFS